MNIYKCHVWDVMVGQEWGSKEEMRNPCWTGNDRKSQCVKFAPMMQEKDIEFTS